MMKSVAILMLVHTLGGGDRPDVVLVLGRILQARSNTGNQLAVPSCNQNGADQRESHRHSRLHSL